MITIKQWLADENPEPRKSFFRKGGKRYVLQAISMGSTIWARKHKESEPVPSDHVVTFLTNEKITPCE